MKKLIPIFLIWNLAVMFSCESSMVEQAFLPEMVAFYSESKTLPTVKVDSVTRFANKVKAFVEENQVAKENPLYPKIQENINAAWFRLEIKIDTAWADTMYYKF